MDIPSSNNDSVAFGVGVGIGVLFLIYILRSGFKNYKSCIVFIIVWNIANYSFNNNFPPPDGKSLGSNVIALVFQLLRHIFWLIVGVKLGVRSAKFSVVSCLAKLYFWVSAGCVVWILYVLLRVALMEAAYWYLTGTMIPDSGIPNK